MAPSHDLSEPMRLRTHLWTSTLAGMALYPRSPAKAALLALAGVAIDLDHLLLYALRTGDWTISGALYYDSYRSRPIRPGDTRPRYGPLRSWLHQPLLVLPLFWLVSRRWPALRPVAEGLTLHLTLDNIEWPCYWQAHRRARRRCEWCGSGAGRLRVRRLPRSPGQRWRRAEAYVALCRSCFDRSFHRG